MKFVETISGVNAARAAGYGFKQDAEAIRDEEFYQQLLRDRGERFVSDKLDELWDLDGSLWTGEDGKAYAVVQAYADPDGWRPLVWHELEKLPD